MPRINRLMPDEPRYCINDTGCGNTVNMTHPRVIQLVMDSLRYWVQEFHVDGFRFDLWRDAGSRNQPASILARASSMR